MENKLKLFQGKSIRSAWNEEEQQWYFSILDVVQVLTDNAMLSNIQSECVQEMKCWIWTGVQIVPQFKWLLKMVKEGKSKRQI